MTTLVRTLFAELKNERKCGKCGASVEDIFINPYCDHVVCAACLHLRQTKHCPTCHGDWNIDMMAPDLTFKTLWRLQNSSLPDSIISETPQRKRKLSKKWETPINHASPLMLKTPKSQTKRNAKGETPLHQYCTLGFKKKTSFDLNVLKMMIEEGANPNTRDAGGLTPMHEAVMYDHLDILKTLLNGGGRVNCYCIPPSTLLHVAVQRYQNEDITANNLPYQILKTLLDYGADINAKDGFNRRSIDIAIKNPSMLKFLTEYKPTIVHREELLTPEPPPTVMWYKSTNEEHQKLLKFANLFNVKLHSAKDQFKPTITHVVISSSWKPSYTLRRALLCGCYIVSNNCGLGSSTGSEATAVKVAEVRQWQANFNKNVDDLMFQDILHLSSSCIDLSYWGVSESVEREQLLSACDFEISEPLTTDDKVGFVSRRARISSMTLTPKLFAGGQFHILSNPRQQITASEKTKISELILDGGGTILSREPKTAETTDHPSPSLFHAPAGSMFAKCSTLILFKYEPPVRFNMSHMKHLPIQWLYECIDGYSIVEW